MSGLRAIRQWCSAIEGWGWQGGIASYRCPICGCRQSQVWGIPCEECKAHWEFTYVWEFSDQVHFVQPTTLALLQYVLPLCLYTSRGSIRPLIFDLKYRGDTSVGKAMGRLLGHYLRSSDFGNTFDAVVPVPLHWRKRFIRGYNQADLFAQGLGEALQIPVARILQRRVYRQSQTKLAEHKERFGNVRGVFRLKEKAQRTMCGKHILLVDDVLTTGATAVNCMNELCKIPQIRISFASIAVRPSLLREAYGKQK